MQADTYITRRLDDQWKIGLWDADVAAPVVFSFFVGYMSASKIAFAICMAAGLWVSRWLCQIKVDKHPAFAIHWLYWSLPPNPASQMRATPPSAIRRMVG